MSKSRFLVNLALSLFVAPIPALFVLGQVAGPEGIPVWVGLAAMAGSAGVYWMAMFSLRRMRGTTAEADGRKGTALVLREPEREAEPEMHLASRGDPRDRNRAHDVRSFEDLPDPLAERQGLKPAEVLIDRVSDITQVKRLVEANKVHLMTAWHRHVRESATGDRDYGDWALEADRLLLSASFMTRTLTRHEAIALVTAEVATRIEARRTEAGQNAGRGAPAGVAAPASGQPARGWGEAQAAYGAPAGYGYAAPQGGFALAQGTPPRSGEGYAPASHVTPQAITSPARGQYVEMTGSFGDSGQPVRQVNLADAAAMPAEAGQAGEGVVRLLPQVVMRRCRALLECGGWRTSTDAEAAAEGIDMLAEREGRIVGLALVAGDDRPSPDRVARLAHAGTMFGADLVAMVARADVDRATRGAATHAGVVLLRDSDLADLAAFLPGAGEGSTGSAGRAAAAE